MNAFDTETTRYGTPRTETVHVQGSAYVVRSAVAANGVLAGERVILDVDGNDPQFYDGAELEDIYGALH